MKKSLIFFVAITCVFFIAERAESANLDRAMISITFDDGESSNMLAQSILTRYQIPGTAYVVTDWVGDDQHLSWDQVWQLHWKYGWEIGNHTFSHKDLSVLEEAQIVAELKGAQSDFLQHGILGQGAFAPPFGEYDSRLVAIMQKLGFMTSSRQAWTEDNAFNDPGTFDEWAINVVSIRKSTTASNIKSLVDQAVVGKKWLVFVVHGVAQVPSDEYQMSSALLTQLASYLGTLRANGKIDTVTASKGAEKMLYYRELP